MSTEIEAALRRMEEAHRLTSVLAVDAPMQILADAVAAFLPVAKVLEPRRFDGRALRLACNIVGDTISDDLRSQHLARFFGIDHMKLYDMDPGDRSVALVDAFRSLARRESDEHPEAAAHRRGELHAALCELVRLHGKDDVQQMIGVAVEDMSVELAKDGA